MLFVASPVDEIVPHRDLGAGTFFAYLSAILFFTRGSLVLTEFLVWRGSTFRHLATNTTLATEFTDRWGIVASSAKIIFCASTSVPLVSPLAIVPSRRYQNHLLSILNRNVHPASMCEGARKRFGLIVSAPLLV